MQKLKKLLTNKQELLELLRYIIAGVITTLLSLIISYTCYILLSENHTINGANTVQLMIGNAVSWVISVIFAFWINRRMVFRVQGGTKRTIGREFIAFVAARAVSWVLLEEGLAALIKLVGVSNLWNRLIVLVLVTVFNYIASKFWIFKNKTREPESVTEASGATTGGTQGE